MAIKQRVANVLTKVRADLNDANIALNNGVYRKDTVGMSPEKLASLSLLRLDVQRALFQTDQLLMRRG